MAETTAVQVPGFISFLLSNKPKFDVYFVVGNKDIGEPERIGGVKLMLMAHSEVLRCELEDSELAEKKDVELKDIHPETFRSLLKYVYGHDIIENLSFDDADNMLYIAEKYMMKELKDKLATRLMGLLSCDNICSLLNNPACYTHLELDSAITEILQYETDRVLESPQFLDVSPNGFLKILQQEGLAVPEIDVWRAAIKWAKHRGGSKDGTVLRKEMSTVEKHIWICTLDSATFCKEVVPTGILSTEEVASVCQSIGTKKIQDTLTTFCNEIKPRKILSKTRNEYSSIDFDQGPYSNYKNPVYYFEVVTKQYPITSQNLYFKAIDRKIAEPEGWTCKVDCTVTIKKMKNPHIHDDDSEANQDNSSLIVRFSEFIKLGNVFRIPLTIDGKYVTLCPESKYSVNLSFTGTIKQFYIAPIHMIQETDDLFLALKSHLNGVRYISYGAVKPVESYHCQAGKFY